MNFINLCLEIINEEHWITKRQNSITGWVSREGKFVPIKSNHFTIGAIKNLNDPESLKAKLNNQQDVIIKRGNTRVIQTNNNTIAINSWDLEQAKRAIKILKNTFLDKTQNVTFVVDLEQNNKNIQINPDGSIERFRF